MDVRTACFQFLKRQHLEQIAALNPRERQIKKIDPKRLECSEKRDTMRKEGEAGKEIGMSKEKLSNLIEKFDFGKLGEYE